MPLSRDHGIKAGVDEHMEIFGDGIEGYQVVDIEVFGNFESKFGVSKESEKNAEATGVGLV